MPVTDWPLEGIDLADLVWTGTSRSIPNTDVGTLFPISIDGFPFLVEVNQVRRRTLDALRTASFQGATPSEQSLSTETAWIRTQRTWRYGSGQLIADSLDDGVDNPLGNQRYCDGFDVEPGSDGEGLSMLRRKATMTTGSGATNTGYDVAVGQYTYAIDGAGTLNRYGPAGITACTGLTNPASSIASDGNTVWVSTFVDATHIAIYSAIGGATAFSAMSAGNQLVTATQASSVKIMYYGNGFLLLMMGPDLVQISATGGLSAVIDTISAPSGTYPQVFSITSSTNQFYFSVPALRSIYRISVDNTGLFGKFTVALPDIGPSEQPGPILVSRALILIGTNKGFHMGQPDGSGNIQIGPLVKLTTSEVNTLAAPYFGVTAFKKFQDKILASFAIPTTGERFAAGVTTTFYNDFAQVEGGLIMIDTGRFSDVLVPSWWFWWRDLVTTGQTTRCTLWENRDTPIAAMNDRWFRIDPTVLNSPAVGITSWYTFGLDATKTYVDIEIGHDALAAGDSIAVYTQVDDDPSWNLIGSSGVLGSYVVSAPIQIQTSARRMRFAYLFTAGNTSQTTTPKLRRTLLRAFPTPKRSEEIIMPLILHSNLRTSPEENIDRVVDTRDAYDFLANLVNTGKPCYLQEGTRTQLVWVQKIELQPDHWAMDPGTDQYRFYQGFLIARLLTL